MEYTGSSYEGDHKHGRMEGFGEYTLPNGTKYIGQMVDGEFHGEGTLVFPNGAEFKAIWEHGRATGKSEARGDYFFSDGLKFEERDWEYCTDDDRRFYRELQDGLRPAGLTLETNGGQAHAIPEGTYDVGDGYLDPKTNKVMDYNGSFLRDADEEEQTWAKTFCRVGKESHVDSSRAQWTKKSPSPK